MGNLRHEMEIAKGLALEAGAAIMERYGAEINVKMKENNSPLTDADMASNRIIIDGLRQEFPEDGFLSEESFDDQDRLRKERVWIVDPLDGTKEFIKKNGEFTVNIGLTEAGKPILGVVYLPVLKELYIAAEGEGASMLKNGLKTPLKPSQTSNTEEMTLIRSRSHASPELQEIVKKAGFAAEKPAGSSLKGCLVAKGDADVYIRLGNTHEWDICAMDAVVREAGATLTDLGGKPLIYNRKDTVIKGLMASNGKNHQRLLELISDGQD